MKKILFLTVVSVTKLHERYVLIKLTDSEPLPDIVPGQFVEVRVDHSPTTFLRRPISVNFVDYSTNELWLLVAVVGEGTRSLSLLKTGDKVNCVLPLGNGFASKTFESGFSSRGKNVQDANTSRQKRFLLVGGGVGVAPLLYQGAELVKRNDIEVTFLLGARTAKDLLLLDEFRKYGRVQTTTEDGSDGERGFVTNHSILLQECFDMIQCCGPTPMMRAVARYAREKGIDCQVSLENMMACGLGACLCCVEKVRRRDADGSVHERNVCVCKEGPVFNISELLWHD